MMYNLIRAGHLADVRTLVEQNPHAYDGCGAQYNTLSVAASSGHLPIVEYLVERLGLDVNLQEANENTALHCVVREGHLDSVKYLIEQKGLDVNAKGRDGDTPLHTAAYHNYCVSDTPVGLMMEYLVEQRGADVNIKNNAGETPLYKAICEGRLPLVEYLVERGGADVNLKAANGFTALHKIGTSHLERAVLKRMAASILEHGADTNITNNAGETALPLMVKKFKYNEAKFERELSCARLLNAARTGNLRRVQELIEVDGANVNDYDETRRRALIYAAINCDAVMFEYLLERRAIVPKYYENDDGERVHKMLKYRKAWIAQAVELAHRWHLPLVAIRTIHEYIFLYNWRAVLKRIRDHHDELVADG